MHGVHQRVDVLYPPPVRSPRTYPVVVQAPCVHCHCTSHCSYVTARSGPQHARRFEWSKWPATCAVAHGAMLCHYHCK
jgi:hypothetical protein